LLAQVDLLFVNQRAVEFLSRTDSLEDGALSILAHGPRIVCVTMGESGSLVVSKEATIRSEAFPVEVVDSTGAGDCFAAGFVHGYLEGWPINQTATFASAVGALSVTQRGGRSSLPSLEEVTTFMAERGAAFPPQPVG
jgi:sugar/nucleoside kinase (ribokinase family)